MKKIIILLVLVAAVFTSCKKDEASQSEIISYFLAHEWQGIDFLPQVSASVYQRSNNDYHLKFCGNNDLVASDIDIKINSFYEDSKGNYIAACNNWDSYTEATLVPLTFKVNPKTGDAVLLIDGEETVTFTLIK